MNITINSFLCELSSANPIPGGGGVSALVGSISASLGCMVCNLTIGKKKYAQFDIENKEILENLYRYIDEFKALLIADEEAFIPLSKAYSLPTDTENSKQEKEAVMEPLLENAALVPLNIMNKVVELIFVLQKLSNQCSNLVISDVGVAIICSKACLESAALNVYINTKFMKNLDRAKKINSEVQALIDKAQPVIEDIDIRVKNFLIKI